MLIADLAPLWQAAPSGDVPAWMVVPLLGAVSALFYALIRSKDQQIKDQGDQYEARIEFMERELERERARSRGGTDLAEGGISLARDAVRRRGER